VTLNVRVGLAGFSEDEKVSVCEVGAGAGGGGGGAAAMSPVCAETATVAPELFEAVTATRSVWPTSLV